MYWGGNALPCKENYVPYRRIYVPCRKNYVPNKNNYVPCNFNCEPYRKPYKYWRVNTGSYTPIIIRNQCVKVYIYARILRKE